MLDEYEERAKAEVTEWFERESSGIRRFVGDVSGALTKPVELLLSTPPAQLAMRPVDALYKNGLQGIANTIPQEKVLATYQKEHPILLGLSSVRQLSLEVPDLVTKNFGAQYVAAGAASGGVSGGVSLIPGVGTIAALSVVGVDVVALSSLGMRMVCDYAAHYGFDPTSREEQLFVKGVMALVGAHEPAQRVLISAELNRIALDLARRATWEQLRKHGTVKLVEKVFQSLGVRLVKRTLAKAVPVVGIAAGAGLNALYLSELDDAARMAYRRRVLQEKERSDASSATP